MSDIPSRWPISTELSGIGISVSCLCFPKASLQMGQNETPKPPKCWHLGGRSGGGGGCLLCVVHDGGVVVRRVQIVGLLLIEVEDVIYGQKCER